MKVIITGSTGMVGKAILIECLESKYVEQILIINRNTLSFKHPKIKEILHKDFKDFSLLINELKGYDACFYCLGVSSAGLNEKKYNEITYLMTEALAKVLYKVNPDMVFNFVSGMGTDSTEKGRVMWARVKGKTENMILNMGFKDAYVFRPGFILPEKGVKSKTRLYNFIYIITRPLYPMLKKMKEITTSSKVGKAMINIVLHPSKIKHLENSDINKIALHIPA